MWAWPLSSHLFVLHEVQPTHGHWVMSFMADWTFRLELIIWAAALLAFFIRRKFP
jgi:inner membrane protein